MMTVVSVNKSEENRHLIRTDFLQVPFSSLEFVALVVYILCIVGELFLLCYFGTVLYEEVS